MTHYKDSSFNSLFYETLDYLNAKKVVFAGRSNAGKSTIINRLMSSKDLTVSLYPSTTLADNVIEYGDYTFIDTPGLLDKDNYSTYLDEESYKLMMIPKTIKPKVFQLDSDQSYFYEGALRVDVKPEKDASVSFFISNNNDIHRTKYDNADNYAEKHSDEFRIKTENTVKHEYRIKGSQMFVIKGLGMIKIKGNADVCMHVDERVRIYLTKEVI
ncbi:MAG: 50S ribosome-binding GTPase [Erysipelotrichaceae bacterium]|nr:50S ribosome-binding GTPase [Erysipelotrichaceae bacterium]